MRLRRMNRFLELCVMMRLIREQCVQSLLRCETKKVPNRSNSYGYIGSGGERKITSGEGCLDQGTEIRASADGIQAARRQGRELLVLRLGRQALVALA